jgi:putative endonuclease
LFPTEAEATSDADLGAAGEKIAAHYLQRIGCRMITRNWRCRLGEVDIICEDKDELVFVEVKSARLSGALPPEVRVNRRKQDKLVMLARHYLQVHHVDRPVRFDLVSVWSENGVPHVRHVKDAFGKR